jgi:hypothetical protein
VEAHAAAFRCGRASISLFRGELLGIHITCYNQRQDNGPQAQEGFAAAKQLLTDALGPPTEGSEAARNWIGNALDASKRSQIMFMDRDDILNLYVVTNLPLPAGALRPSPADPWTVAGDEPPF